MADEQTATAEPAAANGPDTDEQEITDLQVVDEIVARFHGDPQHLIQILQAIQAHWRYLPQPALERLCEVSEISPSQVTSVSTFYRQFRHKPVGEHMVRVCIGTPCHVKGAPALIEQFKKVLDIEEGGETDPNGRYTIEGVACLGCCTLAPVVQIDDITYGHVAPADCGQLLDDFQRDAAAKAKNKAGALAEEDYDGVMPEIRVSVGSCCLIKGADMIYNTIRREVARASGQIRVKQIGCVSMCHVEVLLPGQAPYLYVDINPDQAAAIVHRHFPPRNWLARFGRWVDSHLENVINVDAGRKIHHYAVHMRDPEISAFMGPQVRIATEGFGLVDPTSIEEYEQDDGFTPLRTVLTEWTPEQMIACIKDSGLRGRGGGGFPTGTKWQFGHDAVSDKKYVVCNGDEGDPGAFMDRMLLESFPFRVIEGLAMAAYAIGADEGYFYIRAEYPLAVQRMRAAIALCEQRGYLGERIFGSNLSLTLKVKEGAGAFVCGEETALLESIEGKRGFPRVRPPYPAQRGLFSKPTVINNVETLSMVPWIVRHGADRFAAYGTENSKGTKAFALAGKCIRGGLIEVPMGVTVREVVEDVGGGIADGRRFKAVLIGGPSGGCIPARLADCPVDYEALVELGAMMGSGGFVVLDDRDCMVDIARYFLAFTQEEACGQCSVGRIGTRRILDILDRLVEGQGKKGDIEKLEELCYQVKQSSLCNLCKTAPNPVLTTLQYYREEYEAHLEGRCPSGHCAKLIRYVINDDCNGCTKCAQVCPVDAIPMNPFRKHVVDDDLCTRCDACRKICPVDAVEVH